MTLHFISFVIIKISKTRWMFYKVVAVTRSETRTRYCEKSREKFLLNKYAEMWTLKLILLTWNYWQKIINYRSLFTTTTYTCQAVYSRISCNLSQISPYQVSQSNCEKNKVTRTTLPSSSGQLSFPHTFVNDRAKWMTNHFLRSTATRSKFFPIKLRCYSFKWVFVWFLHLVKR